MPTTPTSTSSTVGSLTSSQAEPVKRTSPSPLTGNEGSRRSRTAGGGIGAGVAGEGVRGGAGVEGAVVEGAGAGVAGEGVAGGAVV